MKISNELRATLRYEGYAKLAAQVMRDQGEYVGDISSLDTAIKSVAVKIAVNRLNQDTVIEGLASYRLLQGR